VEVLGEVVLQQAMWAGQVEVRVVRVRGEREKEGRAGCLQRAQPGVAAGRVLLFYFIVVLLA
jgi:hypothetical protein